MRFFRSEITQGVGGSMFGWAGFTISLGQQINVFLQTVVLVLTILTTLLTLFSIARKLRKDK